MNAIQQKRLLKLIRHLERGKLGHPVFDFGVWDEGKKVNGCRTNGCALGECPVIFPRHWKFKRAKYHRNNSIPILKRSVRNHHHPDHFDTVIVSASLFFGVTYYEAFRMFTPDGANLSYAAKRNTVARHLRKFLPKKKS
jgi:hypothetical protein